MSNEDVQVLITSKADTKGIQQTNKALGELENAASGGGSGSNGAKGGAAKALDLLAFAAKSYIALKVADQIKDAAMASFKSAAGFEQTRIGLENMLGSSKKAGDLLEKISDFAAATPFEFPELADSTRQLVAFGFGAGDAFDTMTQLGDVSAAIGAPIGDLSYLMGTLRVQGRAFTVDLRQFAQRGVPIYEYLAKTMGVAESELSKMVEEGKVGFPEVEKAFKAMTGEGGKFYNTMEKQSKSFNGQVSTLKDNLLGMGRELVGISDRGDVKKGSVFDLLTRGIGNLNEALDDSMGSMVDYDRSMYGYTKTVTDYRTEMDLVDLANRRVERSTKEKADAVIEANRAEEAMPAVLAASNQARENVRVKQDELNQATRDYGADSQIAHDKTKDLELAQYFLNLELINSAGKTLDVVNAQGNLKDKTKELEDATRDYDNLLKGLKDGTIPGLIVKFGEISVQAGQTAKDIQSTVSTTNASLMTLNGVSGSLQNNVQNAEKLQSTLKNIQGAKIPNFNLNTSGTSSGTLKVGNNAGGTDNWRGGPTWVGEEGPELLNLPKGSQIKSNKDSMAMSGSSNTYNIQNVTLSTAEATKVFFGLNDRNGVLASKGLSTVRM